VNNSVEKRIILRLLNRANKIIKEKKNSRRIALQDLAPIESNRDRVMTLFDNSFEKNDLKGHKTEMTQNDVSLPKQTHQQLNTII